MEGALLYIIYLHCPSPGLPLLCTCVVVMLLGRARGKPLHRGGTTAGLDQSQRELPAVDIRALGVYVCEREHKRFRNIAFSKVPPSDRMAAVPTGSV